jgi:hypothetical protein
VTTSPPHGGGGRFRVRLGDGDPPLAEKTGPPGPLAREAGALRVLAGVPGVPRLVRHREGLLVTTRLPGAPVDLRAVPAGDLRRLGRLLARVHAVAAPRGAGADGAAHAAARARDAAALAASAGLDAPVPAAPPPTPAPLRCVHGDLVAGNVVWGPAGPGLVDWEFWRWGDPAEDLAYLAEVNGLDDAALAALAEGHGDPAALARVGPWRPVVALEAGAWWAREGRHDLAEPLLHRAGVRATSGPSGRTSPAAAGDRAGSPPPGRTPPG